MGDPVWYAKWRRLEGQEVVFLEWRIHHEVVRDYHFSGGLADHDCALKYEKWHLKVDSLFECLKTFYYSDHIGAVSPPYEFSCDLKQSNY